MVIYLDVLIVANFIIGYFLLLATAVLSGYTYSRKKIILSALLGALSSVVIFLDIKYMFLDMVIKVSILFICIVVAFGYKSAKKFTVQIMYYIFLNMLLTGMVIFASQKTDIIYQNNMFFYFDINPITLVIFSLIIYAVITVCQLVKEKISTSQTIELSVVFEADTQIKLKAFHDTGFGIKDIINNKDVILVDYSVVKNRLSDGLQKMIEEYFLKGIVQSSEKIVPIFFSTVTGEGSLPAIKAMEVLYNGKSIDNILLALSKNPLSENVEAIFGNDINKQL